MKSYINVLRMVTLPLLSLTASAFLAPTVALAAGNATLTDSTDLTLTTDAVPTGAYTDVTPSSGTAQLYVATASAPFDGTLSYTTADLFDGANSPATNNTANLGNYTIIDPGTLTLTFAAPTNVTLVGSLFRIRWS